MPGRDPSLTVWRETLPPVFYPMIFSAPLRDQCVLEEEFGLWIQILRTVFEGEEQEFSRKTR